MVEHYVYDPKTGKSRRITMTPAEEDELQRQISREFNPETLELRLLEKWRESTEPKSLQSSPEESRSSTSS